MDYNILTVGDCISKLEHEGKAVIIENGYIIGFIEEKIILQEVATGTSITQLTNMVCNLAGDMLYYFYIKKVNAWAFTFLSCFLIK